MKAVRVAISLILVPRVFLTLFIWPLVCGLFFVVASFVLTSALVSYEQGNQTVDSAEEFDTSGEAPIIRRLLFGSAETLPEPLVCRWLINEQGNEVPATPNCRPDRLDAALIVSDPKTFDARAYQRLLNGNVQRIHVCRTCHPDISIYPEESPVRTEAKSIWSFWLVSLAFNNPDRQSKRNESRRIWGETKEALGSIRVRVAGSLEPVRVMELFGPLFVTVNILVPAVAALWLALRAHRKVLDFFARGGALQPLVAGVGGQAFYRAMWILTAFRVATFLGGSFLFLLWMVATDSDLQDTLAGSFTIPEICVWGLAVVSGLTLAAVIGSVSDLKARHSLWSVLYRYVPLVLCLAGGAIWGLSVLGDVWFEQACVVLRYFVSALPVIGLFPVSLGLVIKPPIYILLISAIGSLLLVTIIGRANAQWFARHLEEV